MDSGGSWPAPRHTSPEAFPCQMAGADYYNFGKTGGKGLNRLE
jgi:hypothetical protein